MTQHTARHVDQLLSGHPLARITSGRRSRVRNAAVGGALRSRHLTGRAVDVAGPLSVLRHLAAAAAVTGASEILLERVGVRGQHLHVAWDR